MRHKGSELVFTIPTYRLKEVSETVREYDEHFWRNGQSVKLMVFDDSTPSTAEKYFPLLEQTRTHNELYYVGPREKDRFLSHLNRRLRDSRLEGLVRHLFRPSYGGNRNFTLMYTLGGMFLSADDDMRPYALMEHSIETLGEREVCRGKLYKAGEQGYARRSFDLAAAFLDVLGKPASEAPGNYDRGELLVDTAMDLETNASKGMARENSLHLAPGAVDDRALVKVAQSFRSGTYDMDALDFVELFLDDHARTDPEALSEQYVLVNFRPVLTRKNWRMDCGVAAYDNRTGLPPFFPTRLRFEDYIYRLWLLQDGVVSAHVDAAQNHTKSNYMRNPLASELFNEEVSNLLKRKIKDSLVGIEDMSIAFGYDGSVSAEDSREVLEKISAVHARTLALARGAGGTERGLALRTFADGLSKSFYGFEPDFFQQNLTRIVDDVLTVIKGSMDLWPTLVEIAFFEKARHGLPVLKVANQRA